MRKNRGRTGRKRRRKQFSSLPSNGVNQSHILEYIQLRKWLKERGFNDRNLRPAQFSDTGRGLMTTKAFQAGELIISLPEKCLLTAGTVFSSYLGENIAKWKPPISPLIALCTFLIAEKYAGEQSVWKPYLDVLPKTYTCPVCLDQEVVRLLPEPLRRKAQEQRTMVQELYTSSKSFFSSLQSLFTENVATVFNYDALQWAWCTVNTRTVYMKHSQRKCFSREPDVYALAPYLDLLNHSPNVQVKAAFNEQTRCYEIRTDSHWRRYEELFISYGPHDNQRLLLEYGFVAINNPQSGVYVSAAHAFYLLVIFDIFRNLTFGRDGPSWRLLTALKLLCLGGDEFTYWKKVLLGDIISARNEERSLNIAAKICFSLIEETQQVLHQISQMKKDKMNLENQLALVEVLRLEDLMILQTSAEILCNMHTAIT
uniref:SET domain containing 4 n=1 Tax=Chelonoidis abingdonii TaxID=106734 RepID=A0A8C0GBX0_CHEAB